MAVVHSGTVQATEPEPGHAVFISFVHEDEEVARALQHYIAESLQIPAGVFLSSDQSLVYAGENWIGKITLALKGAQVVVLLLSSRSVKRPWVNFEAGGAWLADKKVIPVCVGNLKIGALPKPYSSLQSLELPAQRHYLLTSLKHHLNSDVTLPLGPNAQALIDELENKPQELRRVERALSPGYRLDEACAKFVDEP